MRAPPPLYDGVGGDADYVRADQDLALRLCELRLPVVAAPPTEVPQHTQPAMTPVAPVAADPGPGAGFVM